MSKIPRIYTKSLERGASGSVPLVMLHGHGGDHQGLLALAESLRRNVYLLDLPGFGQSPDMDTFTVEDYSRALASHIQTLCDGQYDLLGHSMGSAVALGVAAWDAEPRSLIMVNAIPKLAAVMDVVVHATEGLALLLPETVATQAIRSDFYNFVTYMLHSRNRRSLSALRYYMASQKRVNYSFRAWHGAGRAVYDMPQEEYARLVKVPTLLLSGSCDKMSTVKAIEDFSKLFMHSQLETIELAGHFMPQENTLETGRHIEVFLSGLDRNG